MDEVRDEPQGRLHLDAGWEAWLRDCASPDAVPDNLWKWDRTKPLTLAWFICHLRHRRLLFDPPSSGSEENVEPTLRVVVLGGNPEEEENALAFWGQVLGAALPQDRLDLLMIGPQVSPERHGTKEQVTPQLRLEFHRGRFHEYRDELVDSKAYHDPDLVVAFHSGFHFYVESWTSTLVALLNDRVLGCFTSHDSADEKKQWEWLTSSCDFETVIPPSPNPFRCDRKERKRAYNDRLFVIRGLPDSLYVYSSSGPRRLEKGAS